MEYQLKVFGERFLIISYEDIVEANEEKDDGIYSEIISDQGAQVAESESLQNKVSLIKVLTNRQRQVVELLASGATREVVADRLNPPVCVQAVHQIVLRIRKRLHQKAGVPITGWRRTHGK